MPLFVDLCSSQVNPSCLTEKTARNTTQMSVNSKAEVLGKESSQKPRIASIEGNKPSFKAGKTTHNLSSLNTLRSDAECSTSFCLLLSLNSCRDL